MSDSEEFQSMSRSGANRSKRQSDSEENCLLVPTGGVNLSTIASEEI